MVIQDTKLDTCICDLIAVVNQFPEDAAFLVYFLFLFWLTYQSI